MPPRASFRGGRRGRAARPVSAAFRDFRRQRLAVDAMLGGNPDRRLRADGGAGDGRENRMAGVGVANGDVDEAAVRDDVSRVAAAQRFRVADDALRHFDHRAMAGVMERGGVPRIDGRASAQQRERQRDDTR